MDIKIRPYSPDIDEDLLYTTWMKSYRHSTAMRSVISSIYEKGQRYRINRILSRPNTVTYIASDPDNPEVIFGYLVTEHPNIIHYAYTKPAFRNKGIQKALLAPLTSPYMYTHKVDAETERLLKTHPLLLNAVYNPFLL